ncbi:MAG: prepilin-type N-terminal cleavage/methylation domain-containing protein [Gemmatimonas sp.]
MPISRIKAGFTLIELLMVMVVIGLLAAIAIPKFVETKSRAFTTAQKSDLKNLITQQESYFFNNRAYSLSANAVGISPSNGVTLTITEAGGTGWSATTTHAQTAVHCAVFYGTAGVVAPAVVQGVIGCQ